jgi:hypothetical protein
MGGMGNEFPRDRLWLGYDIELELEDQGVQNTVC